MLEKRSLCAGEEVRRRVKVSAVESVVQLRDKVLKVAVAWHDE